MTIDCVEDAMVMGGYDYPDWGRVSPEKLTDEKLEQANYAVLIAVCGPTAVLTIALDMHAEHLLTGRRYMVGRAQDIAREHAPFDWVWMISQTGRRFSLGG